MTSRGLRVINLGPNLCAFALFFVAMFLVAVDESKAQEIFKSDHVVMGYVASDKTADVAGYDECVTSVGSRLSVQSDNSANVEPMFQVVRDGSKVRVARNKHADGNGSYVCLNSSTVKGKLLSGYASSGAKIGKGLSCVLSISNFRKDRVNGGTVAASFRCAYDASTGVVSASGSGSGQISGCGYVCVDPKSDEHTMVVARDYSKVFSGTETIKKNLSCSSGTNYFMSYCSNVVVEQASYAPSTGVVVKGKGGSSGSCTPASFSYLCTKAVPACSDGVDNDGDGATDFPADFSCQDAQDNDESSPKSQCQNGLDDDNDGLIDGKDPGCANNQDNDESDCTTQCQDGIDNDGDGAKDFPSDFSCSSPTDNDETNPKAQCQNGLDDDNDGLVDRNDPGCASNQDNDESDKTSQCQDKIDNDGDGATDAPHDFSCSGPTDNDESNPKAQCQDGVDNDGDGAIDYPKDAGCSSNQDNDEYNVPFQCQNGKDDDGDGLIDMQDPGCSESCDNDESDKTSQCQDKIDNDNDGMTDYPADCGCSSPQDNDEGDVKAQCQDGVDNDGDLLIDYPKDPGCSHPGDNDESNPLPQCKDGKDNDGDGFIDYYHDPGCTSHEDNDETNPKTQCQDGIDNDHDGLTDYPQDNGCSSIWDADEINPLTQCQNGKDDDGDGLIDWKDPGCSDPSDNDETNTSFQCQNGKDDDGDGLIDLKDPGCDNNPCKDDETDPVVIKVTPIAECVDVNQDGTLTAHFGYQNDGKANVEVPISDKNFMSPDKADRGQPTTFFTGRVKNVFTVAFPSTDLLKWTVNGSVAEASAATARCEGSSIECIETDNSATQQGLDSTARRQRHSVIALANRVLGLNTTAGLAAAAKAHKELAYKLYLEQWQDIWGRFPQVSKSCTNCAAVDKSGDIETVQARSRRLERLSRQVGLVLKRARGGKLKGSDQSIINGAAALEQQFQAQSQTLPRFESACGG